MGGKILSVLIQCETEARKAQETVDMGSKFEPLECWRSFFCSATDDIFQVIENSIHIASQDHPSEFSGRCEQLIKSFTDSSERKNEEEVMIIKDLLINWKEQSENEVFESLTKLQSMRLSVGVLKATKIGKVIKRLRKHPVKRIKHLAKLLVNCWKLLEDEQVNTAKRRENYDTELINLFPAKEEGRVSFLLALPVPNQNAGVQATKTECFNQTATTIHSQTEHMEKEDVLRKRARNPQDVLRNSVTVIPLPHGSEQSKKCNDQLFEAKMEATKRKLQDSYLKERLAKKQRSIKVMDPEDLPKIEHRHKMNDRCCPKKWTNCRAKYTALPLS